MNAPRMLSREDCERLSKRVLDLVTSPVAQVYFEMSSYSSSHFARGRRRVGAEVTSAIAWLLVEYEGRLAGAGTNQLDDASLRTLVTEAERTAQANPSVAPSPMALNRQEDFKEPPKIFFESTLAATDPDAQSAIVAKAMDAAEAATLVSAGDVKVELQNRAVANTDGVFVYQTSSYGEFSMTARDASQNASGWGWSGFEDWSRVDAAAAYARAVDLAERSRNPVAVEPGRYTVVLEPAAVADLVGTIADNNTHRWGAGPADIGLTVYGKKPYGTNKIGLQMMDRRLGVVSSPWDPDRPSGTISPNSGWKPVGTVQWFDRGVLRNLAYDEGYARMKGREPAYDPGGMRLTTEGPSTSLEDMIANTKRGIWVTRLSNIVCLVSNTLYLTGTTRDGTFLIENGKVTKPIKNLRFTESPFFVLNQLEAWGDPVRASRDCVVPRLKLRDFNFTSLTDAI